LNARPGKRDSTSGLRATPQARLKGGLRRLDIPIPDEFDEGEYAEATESVYKAVSGICSQSR